MAYILPSDLSWVGSASDTEVVLKLISKAEVRLAAMVAARGGDLAVLAANPIKLALIQDVLENAVARVLRNPDGIRSESEGDYSYTLNSLDAAGNVWFPGDDVDAIFGPSSRVRTLSVGLTPLMRPSSMYSVPPLPYGGLTVLPENRP
jgi:hypothetical protein